jgi:hypothetical protein
MKKKPEPYEWTRRRGLLKAWQLRHYAAWLFPQIARKWMAEGVTDFTRPNKATETAEPYEFPKSTGLITLAHLRHFAAYVFATFGSLADKHPYQWPRSRGVAFIRDLQSLHEHLQTLLRHQR